MLDIDYCCKSLTCSPILTEKSLSEEEGGGRRVILAILDCDDLDAIARLRQILPGTAILSLEDAAVDQLLSEGTRLVNSTPQRALTDRQRQILQLLRQGQSNKAIGRSLGISHFTVRNYVSRLLQTLQVATRKELDALALNLQSEAVA